MNISLPSNRTGNWRLVDYDDKVLNEIPASENSCNLGQLPIGFYRLRPVDGPTNDWISIGVLPSLKVATPLTSPVGLDVAMAWFYGNERMPAVANLCALAGVNWVRDRLAWGEMERQANQFSSSNRYDCSAFVQSQAGLQVLQVNHSSPSWANPKGQRFPTDLRDAYRFYREMAKRWQGQVPAFEPWNEADITMFGGHTGSEMASLQKASWLGLKAGNPQVIACWNVFAMHQKEQLEDMAQNKAWPYFDTFNLHHYSPLSEYPRIYSDFRAVSAGKPLWVTECNVPVKWAGDAKLKELTDRDLRVQAERVAKIFAASLHEGAAVTYYFLLPHYVEGQTQFGILKPDLTPRPAYIALAAVGRLLADATAQGRLSNMDAAVHAYFFKAKPDGEERDVLVAWTDKDTANLDLPDKPVAEFDLLGRSEPSDLKCTLTQAPQFFLFKPGLSKKLSFVAPPPLPQRLEGRPSPIVFQTLFPTNKTILKKSCYVISLSQTEAIPLYIYNFSNENALGRLKIESPTGWQVSVADSVEVAPWDRKEVKLQVSCVSSAAQDIETVSIRGDFGKNGNPMLSLRLKPEKPKL